MQIRNINKTAVFVLFSIIFFVSFYYFVVTAINDGDTLANRKSDVIYNKSYLKVTGATIHTDKGDIGIKFHSGYSTSTIANFKLFTEEGLYESTRFHRVIKGFLIEGGDPLSRDDSQKSKWGTGGPGYFYRDEINNLPMIRGTIAMTNTGKNKNGSQFFILTNDMPSIEGKFTIFGYVSSGMENVDEIEGVPTDGNIPINAAKVNSIVLTE